MSAYWHIVDSQASSLFSSLAKVLALRGRTVTQDKSRQLIKIEPPSGPGFYVKRFSFAGKGLRAYLGRSRARAEWENLQYFHCLGLNTARLVAYGEARDGFRYVRGAYVMREIPDVLPLTEALHLPQYRSWDLRAALLRDLGRSVCKMHAQGFIHRDLYARNVLVSTEDELKLYWIDCPGGARTWGPFFEYGRVRDLACLYKQATDLRSRTNCLRFFLAYVGHQYLTQKDKALIRRVIRYIQRKAV